MNDKADPNPTSDWVEASGVHTGDLLTGDGTPRLHRVLMILGPVGLAVAICLSLWSMSRHVERSVNVQVETSWVPGEQLALRTQLLGPDLAPLADPATVAISHVDGAGARVELGTLTEVGSGLAQGQFEVPADLAPGAGTLELRYELGPNHRIEPFVERLPIEIVAEREVDDGRQVVSESMLQWADDTDEQPEGVRIDLRPDGRLLAGFDNRLFVRVSDPAGKPWRPPEPKPEASGAEGSADPSEAPADPSEAPADPSEAPADPAASNEVVVRLVSGEFDDHIGSLDDPPVIHAAPLDALGLTSFHGRLSSDVVRFEIELPTGASRKLRFVSHAGTVRAQASTDFAHPGDEVELVVEAISARKPVFVDLHAPDGAWVETVTPPLIVPQAQEWIVPAALARASAREGLAPFAQFEAYQSTLRPEDSSAIARIQIAAPGTARADALAPLIERQREQLALPRVDRNFEIGRERAYLSEVERQLAAESLSDEEIDRARAFLIGSLEAVVHGPPQSLNTRAREDAALAAFKRKWTLAIRWLLLGGGGLYILVMSWMVWRNQKALERRTSSVLGLVEGSRDADIDDEAFVDQSLAIVGARRQVLVRGALTIGLMVAALLLTVAMLENLVWEY